MRQAFVASASFASNGATASAGIALCPAYAGVQAFARTHAKEDAGALAWLVLGYGPTSSIEIFPKPSIHSIGPRFMLETWAITLTTIWAAHTYRAGTRLKLWQILADFPKSTSGFPACAGRCHQLWPTPLLLEGQPAEAGKLCWSKLGYPSARTWNLPWAAPMVPQARP